MFSLLLSSLIRGVWAIEPTFAEGYKPIVRNIMTGNTEGLRDAVKAVNGEPGSIEYNSKVFAVQHDAKLIRQTYDISTAPAGSVAIMPLRGAIMKYDYCGSPGTKTMASWLRQANSNPNIIGAVVQGDSGGGEAYATKELADEIKNFSKPIVSHVDGFSCSAAYWINSAAEEVILSSKADVVGSIGTYLTLYDDREWLEANGIKVHEIYASKSINKNKPFKDALDGDYSSILKEWIDPLNEMFIDTVRQNRTGRKLNEEVFTGKTYMGKAAINAGLADSIGSLDYAIARVKKLAKA